MQIELKPKWLDRPIHPALPAVTHERLIFAIIILLAIISRFYNLGARVMSHDESLHTYFSWLLYRGQGYQHTPMMHGPWQFHLIALSYFLFGVSDFTARIPAALFSIATIAMAWYWRRYLGKIGGLIAALLLVISPYLLFYGRYVREDSYAVFAGILMLFVVLRYLETGTRKYLYILVVALVINFLDKETSYINAAQLLIFMAIYFIARVTRQPWEDKSKDFRSFIILLTIGIILITATLGAALYAREANTLTGTETAAPANPDSTSTSPLSPGEASNVSPTIILGALSLITLGAAAYFLIRGYGWGRVNSERSFDLLILTGTLILPLLTPFLMKLLEQWVKVTIPTDAASVQNLTTADILTIAFFMASTFGASILVGWIWRKELWWKLALTFWVPYLLFYTTFFTNSDGFFTGTLGSLGYWIVQQDVQRGSQPWYYYLLVQIPVYEFLPALGFIFALFLGIRRRSVKVSRSENHTQATGTPVDQIAELTVATETEEEIQTRDSLFINTFSLLVWWSLSSLAALSYAGERMPWLTIHITWPMILLAGWAIGQSVKNVDWESMRRQHAWLTLGVIVTFLASLINALLAWNLNPPFKGSNLAQLQATGAFLLPILVTATTAVGLVYLLRNWKLKQIGRVLILVVFACLTVMTARSSFRAAYINYDQATEFLVYAHSGSAVKQVMAQAREISERTVGGLNVAIAYDASAPDTGVSWPFVWYLRDYTNQRSFDAPTRALRDSVVVIVDQKNFDKIEPALGPNYFRIDYTRMWWPMQDYFGLITPRSPEIPFDDSYTCKGFLAWLRILKSHDYSRICNAITDPQIRAGIIDIWWNRDYTRYAQATGHSDLTLATWQPSDAMRLYLRKDIASQIWNYGVGPVVSSPVVDPTEGKSIELVANLVIDGSNIPPPGLNYPRSLAFSPDRSFYVADSLNHRILHLDSEGNVLGQWGSFAQGTDQAPAPLGTFNEPWGIAVGPDGSVYVTDTWNHRVQKFTADGRPLLQWGYFGQGETPDAFYGPRGIAVDRQGRVYVADTGNKRIVVFDAMGNPLSQIGTGGFEPGQFDEPVGIAVDTNDRVYVADTWNQRVQTFILSHDGTSFTPESQWEVFGWIGQSLENKPFIAVDAGGHVFITDPEGYRILEYTGTGELVRVWGDYGNTNSTFGLPSGIAVDSDGYVWVTDASFQRILKFTLP